MDKMYKCVCVGGLGGPMTYSCAILLKYICSNFLKTIFFLNTTSTMAAILFLVIIHCSSYCMRMRNWPFVSTAILRDLEILNFTQLQSLILIALFFS
jgi:hypothetical protein